MTAIKKYCSLVMKYFDRDVIQDFLYTRMKQLLHPLREEARKGWRKEFLSLPARKHREVIERMLVTIFQEIEKQILAMAHSGRRLHHELPNGHVAVLATLPECGRQCVLILEEREAGEAPYVIAFKTTREYDRHREKRFRRRGEPYYNSRFGLRH
jgi:5-methylthioribose kinase